MRVQTNNSENAAKNMSWCRGCAVHMCNQACTCWAWLGGAGPKITWCCASESMRRFLLLPVRNDMALQS